MSEALNEALIEQKQAVIDEMLDYMNFGGGEDEDDEEFDPDFDAEYEQAHVDQCDALLTRFLIDVHAHQNAATAALKEDVKSLVLKLNALNESVDGMLIETDQRERICALIFAAVEHAGWKLEEDITEEWREW